MRVQYIPYEEYLDINPWKWRKFYSKDWDYIKYTPETNEYFLVKHEVEDDD